MNPTLATVRLRRLPCEVRAALAAILVLATAGYAAEWMLTLSRMAGSGEVRPGPERLREYYAGRGVIPVTPIERVLEAVDGPFNGTGTMRPAFTSKSEGWDALLRDLPGPDREKVFAERDGERVALLAWLRAGADRGAYDRDEFDAGAGLTGQPISPAFANGPGRVRIRTLIETRCTTCHSDGGKEDRARLKPLDTFARLAAYATVPPNPQISMPDLQQWTAERLPVRALVMAITGVLYAFSGVPHPVRRVITVLPLVALALSASCQWFARADSFFVWGIAAGEVVAGGGFVWQVWGIGRELAAGRCIPPAEGLEFPCPPLTGR